MITIGAFALGDPQGKTIYVGTGEGNSSRTSYAGNGMDGWEFLSRLDRNRSDRRVPVVLLSGLAYIRDAPGVADFLAKPIRPDRLLECVRRFCPQENPAR